MAKKRKRNEDGVRLSVKIMAITLVFIMVFSVAGFVVMLSPFGFLNSGNPNNPNLPSNLPLQQFQQDGFVFWAGIKNNEIFQFETIEGFDERQDLALLANQLSQMQVLQLYVDPQFTNSNVLFMVEKKIPSALNLQVSRIFSEFECSSEILVITYNDLLEERFENCLVFSPIRGQEIRDVEILSYHIVR